MKRLVEASTKAMIKETKNYMDALVDDPSTLKPELKVEVKFIDGIYHVAIPEEMSLIQGAYSLLQRFEEEEKTQAFTLDFKNIFLNDVVLTMKKILPEIFGKIINSPINTQGRAASPVSISFVVDYQADGTPIHDSGFLGSVIAPLWENAIIDITPTGLVVLSKKKYEHQINRFFEEVNGFLKSNSVVKGHAVTIQKVKQGLLANPVFIKTNAKIVLNDDTKRIVDNLVIPSLGEKQKKTLLFTGDFGTLKLLFDF